MAKASINAVLKRIKDDVMESLKDVEPITIPAELCNYQNQDQALKPILYSDELNYLNANWANWNSATEITSHRRLIGPIIVKVKKFLVDIVWDYILKSYCERERNFNMNLVRYLNASARYIDARDKENFWQLINKLDNDMKCLTDRVDYLFTKGLAETGRSEVALRSDLERLSTQLEQLKNSKGM